jgi:hypothetical protein
MCLVYYKDTVYDFPNNNYLIVCWHKLMGQVIAFA